MGADRDVGRFDRWADDYDGDALQGRFFQPVYDRTLGLLERLDVGPRRVLDVGCGTGTLLRGIGGRLPAARLVGVDAAPRMAAVAGGSGTGAAGIGAGSGVAVAGAAAERLPFADGSFDLVTSTLSFHHWADQRRGLAEIARVLAAGGTLVLVDLHSIGPLLRVVHRIAGRRHRMHTRAELTGMLAEAGLRVRGWHPIFDLDVLLPLRRGAASRPPTGRFPLVTAVVADRDRTGPVSVRS